MKERILPAFFIVSLIVLINGYFYFNPLKNYVETLMYSPVITEFHGFNWETPPAKIKTKYGSAKFDTVTIKPSFLGKGIQGKIIKYEHQEIAGETGTIEFLFHPDEGLVKGLYIIQFDKRNDCKRIFKKLWQKIQKKLKTIEADISRINRTDYNFCRAQQMGKASKISQWEDPASNAMVTLAIGVKKMDLNKIVALFESQDYYNLIRN